MKSRILMCITAMTLFAALAIQVRPRLAAQEQGKEHTRYRLIDLGTLGGPASYVNETIPFVNGSDDLNSRGLVVGSAATSIPTTGTSNFLVCGGLDGLVPNVFHAFAYQHGTVTDLGALPGADNCSVAYGSNVNGDVVGNSENGEIDPLTGVNQTRPVLWKDGHITDLGTFGGNQGNAISINNRGQIVGGSLNTTPDPFSIFDLLLGSSNGTQTRAFLWQDKVRRDLGTLGGPDAVAILVNERGQVAGDSYTNSIPNPVTGTPTLDPFLWENGKLRDLGTLGGTMGFPLALNNRGQVVGQSNLAGDLTFHPFLWDRGVLRDLGTFGGDTGLADSINDTGEVVGVADLPGDLIHHAFLWRDGVKTDLGTLGFTSFAFAINSEGQVVGASRINPTTAHAFLWERGGPMVDLNTRIPPGSSLLLTHAFVINDRGEIAGVGVPAGCSPQDFSTCGHAYVLIPCGEGEEGCEDNTADAAAGIQNNSAPLVQRPSTATPANPALSDGPSGMLDRLRARRFPRYHVPGHGTGPTN